MSKSTKSTPNPAPKKLTDAQLKKLDYITDVTIRELVFMATHAGEDQMDDAHHCLTAVAMNISSLQDILEAE